MMDEATPSNFGWTISAGILMLSSRKGKPRDCHGDEKGLDHCKEDGFHSVQKKQSLFRGIKAVRHFLQNFMGQH